MDGRSPAPDTLDPALLATGAVVSVSLVARSTRTCRRRTTGMRRFPCGSRFPAGTSSALVAVSGEVLAGRVGTVLHLGQAAPDVAAYQRRFGRTVRAPLASTHRIEDRQGPRRRNLPHNLPAVTSGPRSDVGLRHVRIPKLGSYGLAVNLSSPKRPVLFEARGLSKVLSITDLDGERNLRARAHLGPGLLRRRLGGAALRR